MKKLISLIIAGLFVVMVLASCAGSNTINYTAAEDQLTALRDVKANNSDIAVMDSVMANFYCEGSTFGDLMVLGGDDFKFDSEYYAIGFRKGSNAVDYINYALYVLSENGKYAEIGEKYGLTDTLCEIESCSMPEDQADSDYAYIKGKGEIVIGYTVFEPIAYKDGDDLVGFDIDLAKEVADILDIEVKFEVINWNSKEQELNAKNIDCIWNGFTYTEERAENISFSKFYMENRQVMVIREADADKYATYASMKNAAFAAEGGSAGEKLVKGTIQKNIFG